MDSTNVKNNNNNGRNDSFTNVANSNIGTLINVGTQSFIPML